MDNCRSNRMSKKGCCNSYARTGKRNSDIYITLIVRLLKTIERLVLSDEFAAGFCGASFLVLLGIVGGVEFGSISLSSGVTFGSVIIAAVSVIIYKKNKE